MLKKGDKVRLRTDLEINRLYGDCLFIPEMNKYINRDLTVQYVRGDDVLVDESGFYFNESMFQDSESRFTPFYMVFVEGAEAPKYKHPSKYRAQNEAERLAVMTGKPAYVLEAVECKEADTKIKSRLPLS